MAEKKSNRLKSNLLWLILIVALIIPQSRRAIQVTMHSLFSKVNSAEILEPENRVILSTFNWNLLDEDNQRINFSKAKGKVVLINFWATWCPPCIAEMDSLEDLYKAYGNEVVFMFVTNDDMELVDAFKTKKGYTLPVYNPLTQIPKEFETRSIPRTFILNKKGEIVVDEKGAVDWNSEDVHQTLNDLLGQ
jgi:thiol-disulfide isomerase/thioredoxin